MDKDLIEVVVITLLMFGGMGFMLWLGKVLEL